MEIPGEELFAYRRKSGPNVVKVATDVPTDIGWVMSQLREQIHRKYGQDFLPNTSAHVSAALHIFNSFILPEILETGGNLRILQERLRIQQMRMLVEETANRQQEMEELADRMATQIVKLVDQGHYPDAYKQWVRTVEILQSYIDLNPEVGMSIVGGIIKEEPVRRAFERLSGQGFSIPYPTKKPVSLEEVRAQRA